MQASGCTSQTSIFGSVKAVSDADLLPDMQVVFPLLFGARTGNLSILKTFSGGLQPCPWSVFLHLLGANAGASG